MLMVILFLGVVTSLTVGVSAVVIDSTKTANRDRQALGALSTAEGGVAQAVQFIRANPPGTFTCKEPASLPPTSGNCVTNVLPWTNASQPEKVSSGGTVGLCVAGQACFSVWISTLQPYNPLSYPNAAGTPSHSVVYRIHSTGISGGGPAARSLVVDIAAKLATFPLGVYSDSISMNGTPDIHHESVYSVNCVSNRDKISFDPVASGSYAGYDWATDSPQAVHSPSYISTSGTCTNATSSIHAGSAICSSTYPYDQDASGAVLTSANPACFNAWTSPATGKQYSTTSLFTTASLYATGYQPQGLTPAEYDALQVQAQASGTYNPSNISAALSAITSGTAVLYVDNSDLTIGPGDIPSQFFRNTTSDGQTPIPGSLDSCATASNFGLNSLIIVVQNGHDLRINSFGGQGGNLVASIFVPGGSYDGAGNAPIIGTIYAQDITLRGTQDFYLDQCFVNNPPSLLLDMQQVRYHEVDTQNVQ
jgi:type II secretory pathway pseudopilin PulG